MAFTLAGPVHAQDVHWYTVFTKTIFNLGQDLPSPLLDAKLVIKKGDRTLSLYSGNQLLRNYSVGLGSEPVGHKMKEGDGKTPEGEYLISSKNLHSAFFRSLALNYPNARDGRRAREAGVISSDQNEQIFRASRRAENPPWKTPLGGEIFIHGNGSASDWTDGCIALDNPAMLEIFEAVPLKTPVIILP